jgi:predicted transcriptional regulator
MAWTDDTKAKAIELYEAAKPTPENSMEVVKEIAEELGETANGVRMILSKAGVYVKKEAAASAKKTSTSAKEGGSTRVSKEDAHAKLTAAIEAAGGTVDSEIVSKLTGKAAVYLATVIEEASK